MGSAYTSTAVATDNNGFRQRQRQSRSRWSKDEFDRYLIAALSPDRATYNDRRSDGSSVIARRCCRSPKLRSLLGLPDDEAWTRAQSVDTFTPQDPIESARASKRTEVGAVRRRHALVRHHLRRSRAGQDHREPGRAAMRSSPTRTPSSSCWKRSTITRTRPSSAPTRSGSTTTGGCPGRTRPADRRRSGRARSID